MARTIKHPVVATMSKTVGEKLFLVLHARPESGPLANIVGEDIDTQVGRSFTMELSRKDALAMHSAALHDIQRGADSILGHKAYGVIGKAFRDAYDARLLAMSAR